MSSGEQVTSRPPPPAAPPPAVPVPNDPVPGPVPDVPPPSGTSGAPRHMVGGATRRQRLLAIVAVALVAFGGVGLRAALADTYSPWQHHWDEITNMGVGERMSADLSPDPGFYDYPALVFLAQATVLVPAAQFGDYDPDTDRIIEFQSPGNGRLDEPGLVVAMRWVTGVLPGAATVAAAGAIAWATTRRWWAAGLAALLAAISAVDLRYGVLVTPDAMSGAAATLATLGAVRVAIRPTRLAYVLTGAAVGLAAAAKYNAAIVVVSLLVAHWLTHRSRPFAHWRPLAEAAGGAAVVFAVVNLGAVLHPLRFFREIGSEGFHYSNGHLGSEGNSPAFNAWWLWQSFGLALLFVLVALLARTDRVRRAAIVLASFAVGYYAFLGIFPVRFARNLLPLTGTIAAGAAVGLFVAGQHLGERLRRPLAVVAPLAVAAVAMLAIPVVSASAAMRDADDDPWTDARAWIDDNLAEGSVVALEARTPYVDPSRYWVVSTISLGNHNMAWYRERRVDYFVTVSEMYQPALDAPRQVPEAARLYRQVLDPACRVFENDGAGLHIVVTRMPPCSPD